MNLPRKVRVRMAKLRPGMQGELDDDMFNAVTCPACGILMQLLEPERMRELQQQVQDLHQQLAMTEQDVALAQREQRWRTAVMVGETQVAERQRDEAQAQLQEAETAALHSRLAAAAAQTNERAGREELDRLSHQVLTLTAQLQKARAREAAAEESKPAPAPKESADAKRIQSLERQVKHLREELKTERALRIEAQKVAADLVPTKAALGVAAEELQQARLDGRILAEELSQERRRALGAAVWDRPDGWDGVAALVAAPVLAHSEARSPATPVSRASDVTVALDVLAVPSDTSPAVARPPVVSSYASPAVGGPAIVNTPSPAASRAPAARTHPNPDAVRPRVVTGSNQRKRSNIDPAVAEAAPETVARMRNIGLM